MIICLFTASNIQICSNEACLSINTSTVADSGIVIAPVRRSVRAMLHNKMFESFCSSLPFFIATIANVFKKTVTGEARKMMATKLQAKVVFRFESDMRSGIRGQKNTDLSSEVV